MSFWWLWEEGGTLQTTFLSRTGHGGNRRTAGWDPSTLEG